MEKHLVTKSSNIYEYDLKTSMVGDVLYTTPRWVLLWVRHTQYILWGNNFQVEL